ncbi:hypothetical protein OURE66S_03255 [Oligella ureolytica]
MRFIILTAIVFIALLLINRALSNARQAIQRDKNEQRANNARPFLLFSALIVVCIYPKMKQYIIKIRHGAAWSMQKKLTNDKLLKSDNLRGDHETYR